MIRKTYTIKNFALGLISDLTDVLNVGFKTFRNVYLDSIGNLTKRNGWKVLFNRKSYNTDDAGMGVDYAGATDTNKPMPFTFNAQLIDKEGEDTYGSIIFHKFGYTLPLTPEHRIEWIKTDENWYNDGNSFVPYIASSTTIGDINAIGSHLGPTQFIQTPDQTYLIHGYINKGEAGDIWKFENGKLLKTNDIPKLRQIFLPKYNNDIFHLVLTSNAPAGSPAMNNKNASYYYKFVFVMNTGALTPATNNKGLRTIWTISYTLKNEIQMKPLYNPHIKYVRIYRTKKIEGEASSPENLDYYFVDQVEVPTGSNPTAQTQIYLDGISDNELGDVLIDNTSFNTKDIDVTSLTGIEASDFYVAGGGLVKGTCGLFADNRLLIGDINEIHVSDADHTDDFKASRTYKLDKTDISNRITNLISVGNTVYVFTKTAIYSLKPTYSDSVPYSLDLVSSSEGCDIEGGAVSFRSNGYFIFNKKFYRIDGFGAIKEVGENINKLLNNIDYTQIQAVKLFVDPKRKAIRIHILSETQNNIVYYPETNTFADETGYTWSVQRKTAPNGFYYDVVIENNRKLLGYSFVSKTLEYLAMDYNYNIITTTDDYVDVTSRYDVSEFPTRYSYNITIAPQATYNIIAEIEKSLSYNEKFRFSSILLRGQYEKILSYAGIDGVYTDTSPVVLTGRNTEYPVNKYGMVSYFKITDNQENDIALDSVMLKIELKNKGDLTNVTKGA